ncbi:MAG TPA: acetyl-CoA carboxylase biotin carboxyl carrier protein [bacterium]|nr:acetyl-CoA carboxylase biotin carboxyl carrier protein [bacterium]
MKTEELKIYADFMKTYGLEYLEVKKGDFCLVMGKKGTVKQVPNDKKREQFASDIKQEEILEEYKRPSQQLENVIYVKSPLVGTFYRSPSPQSPPFAELGTSVKQGTTLCIIEAMKVMNEIKSEHNGVIKEILVENGKSVEYGQVLFVIQL